MDYTAVRRTAVRLSGPDWAGHIDIRVVTSLRGAPHGRGSQALPPLRLYRLSPQAAGRSTGERGS